MQAYDNNEHSGVRSMTHRTSIEPGPRHWRVSVGPRHFPLPAQFLAFALFACGPMQGSWAGEITVHVSKRGAGYPVEAAAVCLGTPADPAQFGAMIADDKGIAQFDKVRTRTDLILTVSKSGYKGRQVALGNDPRDRGVLLTLAAGGGGPECEKALALADQTRSMASPSTHFTPGIADFRINGGEQKTRSTSVTLDYVLTGEASHYRASDRSDFESAEWQPLESDLRLELTGDSGLKTIYFQVGKIAATEGAEIEILSNIAVDTIELVGG